MPLPGYEDYDIPPELLLHVLNVERQTGTGHDAQGNLVEQWTVVYSGLQGTAVPRAAGRNEEFEQAVMTYPFDVYLAPLADGTVPDIRVGDRIPFKTWPSGQPRYINVSDAINVVEVDVVVQVTGIARKPG